MLGAEYLLSEQIQAHDSDVRGVCTTKTTAFCSVSRDKLLKEWTLQPSHSTLQESKVFMGHSRFVNCVAFLQPNAVYPNGLVVTGGMDKMILIWDTETSAEPIMTLIEHEDAVCHLSTLGDLIVSSSWDRFHYHLCEYELHAVNFLTIASADRTIKLWNSGVCIRTFKGHTDVVRGLTLLPGGNSFASCSNDGSLRVWLMDGSCIHELYGHSSFVYSIAVLASGELVSTGEDATVRVWKDSACVQTINLPAISIWCACILENQDLVVGANDGQVRIFTRESSRVAPDALLQTFNQSISRNAISSDRVGDVDKTKLPGVEVLEKPGNKDQQVVMVKGSGGIVEAHQWSESGMKWLKIGEVTDAVGGSSRKSLYQGKEYDYVFDVDIQDGVPSLKLPFNVTENPYDASQQFIHAHDLPQSYLDQIADFIMKNVKTPLIGNSNASNSSDPFTGQSRYVPGSAMPASSAPSVIESNADLIKQLLPLTNNEYLTFKMGNVDAIVEKIKSLNVSSVELVTQSLQPQELELLDGMKRFLKSGGLAEAKFDEPDWHLLQRILQWPTAVRFPGLDLLRLVVLRSSLPVESELSIPGTDASTNFVLYVLERGGICQASLESSPVNMMLALRVLCNTFDFKVGRDLMWKHADSLISTLGSIPIPGVGGGSNLLLAFVTLHLNFAVMLYWVSDDAQLSLQVALNLLKLSVSTDDEVLYRALMALGTLMKKYKEVREVVLLMDGREWFSRCEAMSNRLQSLTQELNGIF